MTQAIFEQASELVQQNRLESYGPYGGGRLSTHRYDERSYGRIYHGFPREEKWRWLPKPAHIGGFGMIWKVSSAPEGGASRPHLRAVKQMRKGTNGVQSLLQTSRELETAFKFSDSKSAPRFVRSYGWFEDAGNVFLAMEYLPHGDLRGFISEPLPETAVKCITSQLVDGLLYMHQNGVTHRDLKPANVLVVKPHPTWEVKLGDFGISKFVHGDTKLETVIGTSMYMAPEIRGHGYTYTSTVDMWSLGITVLEMLTGSLNTLPVAEPLELQPLIDRGVSELCQGFLKNLLVTQPDQRMNSESAHCHPWIQTQVFIDSSNPLLWRMPTESSAEIKETGHSGNFWSKLGPAPKTVSPQQNTPPVKASTTNDRDNRETSRCTEFEYTVNLKRRNATILDLAFELDSRLEILELRDRLGLALQLQYEDASDLKLSYVDIRDNSKKALDDNEDLSKALEQGNKLQLHLEPSKQTARTGRAKAARPADAILAAHIGAHPLRKQRQKEENSLNSPPSPGQIGNQVEETITRDITQRIESLAASSEASRQGRIAATQQWVDVQGLIQIKDMQPAGRFETPSSMAVCFNSHRKERSKLEPQRKAKSKNATTTGKAGRKDDRNGRAHRRERDDARRQEGRNRRRSSSRARDGVVGDNQAGRRIDKKRKSNPARRHDSVERSDRVRSIMGRFVQKVLRPPTT